MAVLMLELIPQRLSIKSDKRAQIMCYLCEQKRVAVLYFSNNLLSSQFDDPLAYVPVCPERTYSTVENI